MASNLKSGKRRARKLLSASIVIKSFRRNVRLEVDFNFSYHRRQLLSHCDSIESVQRQQWSSTRSGTKEAGER